LALHCQGTDAIAIRRERLLHAFSTCLLRRDRDFLTPSATTFGGVGATTGAATAVGAAVGAAAAGGTATRAATGLLIGLPATSCALVHRPLAQRGSRPRATRPQAFQRQRQRAGLAH
jgi:hypothetical protein